MKKALSFLVIFFVIMAFFVPPVFAVGAKEFGASLLLPTTGQAMNGQLGSTKTKIMGGIEVAAITTTIVLGFVVGGPVVWAGVGPLIANHAWAAADAYVNAQNKSDPYVQQQMVSAQRTLDVSRQNRFARESDIRQKIIKAGEESY